ncbi:cytochrome P450 [Nocardiopsis exhalans]|uniref:Cytochrome P450 n=1 Tax=Nocardiopsis exhalans TaxID=163604 RepID=A0ABY5DFQ9_9ACTN|nr:cytochrome P450 [Nocardiopsis exhalans]USY22852.1 cytochrome P450 [Nocardiopsis exhalans]
MNGRSVSPVTTCQPSSLAETAEVLTSVLLPTVVRGAIVRRPAGEALATATESDRRMVSVLRSLRERHGDDPLPLRHTGRRIALVLAPEDVRRILEGTPDPFSPGGAEKRGALSHFQPHGALVSDHRARPRRRRANEEALALGELIHPEADTVAEHAYTEARALVLALRDAGSRDGVLDWSRFSETFDALARRVVFGSFAVRDRRTTELLRALRARANWSYLLPADQRRRTEFLDRVRANIDRAEAGSLAARLGRPGSGERPEDQVAHWLFAFDAAAIAAFRALALLTSSGPAAEAARTEALTEDGADLPLLRATLRESVRLWPTTLVVIRESTRETVWRERTIEPGTAFLVMSSYFHRDPAQLPYADTFEPGVWTDGRAEGEPAIVPFSHGPAGCPGRDLVPLTVSFLLRTLLRGGPLNRVDGGPPLRSHGLPSSLNHFDLRFSY